MSIFLQLSLAFLCCRPGSPSPTLTLCALTPSGPLMSFFAYEAAQMKGPSDPKANRHFSEFWTLPSPPSLLLSSTLDSFDFCASLLVSFLSTWLYSFDLDRGLLSPFTLPGDTGWSSKFTTCSLDCLSCPCLPHYLYFCSFTWSLWILTQHALSLIPAPPLWSPSSHVSRSAFTSPVPLPQTEGPFLLSLSSSFYNATSPCSSLYSLLPLLCFGPHRSPDELSVSDPRVCPIPWSTLPRWW